MLNALKKAVQVAGVIVGTAWIGVSGLWSAQPGTTAIQDVIYNADGSPASGSLIVSWPTFTAPDGKPVAAGQFSTTVGANGTVALSLVPNAGATPDGTYYKIVFKSDTGSTETESWVVPSSATPVTIAAVRAQVVPSSVAMQMASRQYVDSAIASRATNTSVVHLSGVETIAGAKQFAASPSVPAPVQATDAVNKSYVDLAVQSVGAGSYVQKTGDAMTGPLSLPGDPTAPAQAARKQYVDTQITGKADKVGGLVPATEMAMGTPDGTKCLKGDQTWGACGTSSNAIQLQGRAVDATAPSFAGDEYAWAPSANSGQGAWTPQSKAEIDVRDYGVVCDGVTDAAPALQALFNSLVPTRYNGHAIRIPPAGGACVINSTVNIKVSNLEIHAYGARFKCSVANGPCFFVGDPSNSNDTINVSWYGGRFFPGVPNGTQSVFQDNAQSTRFVDLVAGDSGGAERIGHFIEDWDNENEVIDGLRMSGIGHFIRCDATFCGSAIYAPGGFGVHPGIASITHSDLGMQCGGNSVDWHSGNYLFFGPGNIVQGYAQFGIRYDRADGYANKLDVRGVYREVGNCSNPMGNVGQADLIIQGNVEVEDSGGVSGGVVPRFSNTGTNHHQFFLVATDAGGRPSMPLPAGYADSNNSGTFHVYFPRIAGTTKYDLLVSRQVAGADNSIPYGANGQWAASTNILDTSCAPNPICDVVYDPAAALQSYATVPALYGNLFTPKLDFWPGAVVLSPSAANLSSVNIGLYVGSGMASPIVSVAPSAQMSAWNIAKKENGAEQWPVLGNVPYNTLGYVGGALQRGYMMFGVTEGGWTTSDSQRKGRLNFGGYSWNNLLTADLITCRDSNLLKTMAHASLRPTADAGDCALGVAGPDIGYLRSKSGWRFYFNALPTGPSDTNGIDLNATGINLPAGATFKVGGTNIAPLTTKGDLLGFGTGPARVPLGGDGQCLIADSAQTLGVKWGACATGSGGGGGSGTPGGANTNVQFNDNGILGGVTDFSFNKLTGDLTVAGRITASSIQTTGTGAWSVEGAYAAMTPPSAGKSKLGFGAAGQLQIAENGAATFTDIAKTGHTHLASDIVSGTLAAGRLPVMGASGAAHAAGAVPDPGATAGTTKYLREDGTWVVPSSGGGSGTPGGQNTQVQFNDGGSLGGNSGFTFDKTTGNVNVGGTVTATSFVSNGTGPWSIEGSYGTLGAPATGKSKLGFGAAGQLQVAENGSATFVDLSKAGHTHAESDVSGLATDLPKGIQTAKGDLIAYGTAPARLGVGADGQVLVADSNQAMGVRWAYGPGANVTTVGQGFVFLPYITVPSAAPAASTPVAGSANQVKVVQFTLPFAITVGKMTTNIQTASSGQTFYAGVYDTAGNKLLEGSFSCGTANGVSFSLGSPVTLMPGTYLYAYSASDTVCAVNTIGSTSTWVNYLTKNATRVATAQNSVSGGAMPATLGTLTYYGASNIVVTMLER